MRPLCLLGVRRRCWRLEPSKGLGVLPDDATHLIQASTHKPLPSKGSAAGQQFVEEHAQRIDVAARINVDAADIRLLRAHISRRAYELMQLRVNRAIRQPPPWLWQCRSR